MGAPVAVGIPRVYREPLEAEHQRLGHSSKVETLKVILDFYFEHQKQPLAVSLASNEQPLAPPATPLPVSEPTEEKREVFVSYVNQSDPD
jgi:hypothetical protein